MSSFNDLGPPPEAYLEGPRAFDSGIGIAVAWWNLSRINAQAPLVRRGGLGIKAIPLYQALNDGTGVMLVPRGNLR